MRRGWPPEPSSPASPSTRWTSATAPSTSTTGSAISAACLPTVSRGSSLWSSGWSTCILTTAGGCWSAREELHDGRLEQLFLEYRFLPPSRGAEVDPAHRPRRRARRRRTHGQVVRRAPRRHGAQASRAGAARPEPAADPGPGGGARAARPRAARRREPAARRAGDRRRPQRARGRGQDAGGDDAGDPRGAHAPQRGHPLPGLSAAPVGPGGARPGRGAAGGVRAAWSAGASSSSPWTSVRCPAT